MAALFIDSFSEAALLFLVYSNGPMQLEYDFVSAAVCFSTGTPFSSKPYYFGSYSKLEVTTKILETCLGVSFSLKGFTIHHCVMYF